MSRIWKNPYNSSNFREMDSSQRPSEEFASRLLRILALTMDDFLQEFCNYARDRFGANTVFVSSLGLIEAEYIVVEAMSDGHATQTRLEVQSKPTPCHKVLTSGEPYFVCQNVQETYPEAKIIERFRSQAYLGLPLKQTDGSTLGLVELEWSEPAAPETMELAIEHLSPYLSRISEELVRKTQEHALATLITPVTPLDQHAHIEIFRTIAEQAAAITKVHSVSIVYRNGRGAMNYRILASICDGRNVPEEVGQLDEYFGLPCSNMIDKDVHFEAEDVRKHYPGMPLLERLKAESYLGFGFRNTEGETIGHIAFLHNRPMRPSVQDSNVIRVIASRVGQELQRYALERQREAMAATLRVRSKLESLGTMAGTIAHDFNNQLTSILGNTELAALAIEGSHPTREFLANVEQSTLSARDVVAELMDFAGNSTSAPLESVSLGEVVASAVNEFRPRLDSSNRIISDVRNDIPEIKSRRIRIFQILTNLISNGLDAFAQDTDNEIKISVYLTQITDDDRKRCLTGSCSSLPSECICIEIKDTGRGMDADEAERIFDPFFSTKGVSRGLGLSSVLGIAKRLGVGMTMDSKVGVGTVFKLYFKPGEPATISDSAEKTPPDPSSQRTRKFALVVDDDESVNGFISKALTVLGWEVDSAFSGEDAIEVAQSTERLDLAFIDVVMSGMNGVETLTELRKIHPGIATVIVSGYDDNNLPNELIQDGTLKRLAKPFGLDAIRNVTATLFSDDRPE